MIITQFQKYLIKLIKFNCYQRKVAEGKKPMSVLNAVRFKLICRIFSVVKRNEEFKKEYQKVAA